MFAATDTAATHHLRETSIPVPLTRLDRPTAGRVIAGQRMSVRSGASLSPRDRLFTTAIFKSEVHILWFLQIMAFSCEFVEYVSCTIDGSSFHRKSVSFMKSSTKVFHISWKLLKNSISHPFILEFCCFFFIAIGNRIATTELVLTIKKRFGCLPNLPEKEERAPEASNDASNESVNELFCTDKFAVPGCLYCTVESFFSDELLNGTVSMGRGRP